MTQHACINHPATASVTQCFQCHKPICKVCVFETEFGRFCGNQCSANHRLFRSTYMKQREGAGTLAGTLVRVAVFLAVVLVVVHAAVRFGGVKAVAAFDVIGKVIGYKPAGEPPPEPPQ